MAPTGSKWSHSSGSSSNERRQRVSSLVQSVYKEICDAYDDDPLRTWAEARSGPPLFLEPDETVQRCLSQVVDYVIANYDAPFAAGFLSKADPWIIAHAKAAGGRVVGFERWHGEGAKRPQIPNVCRGLGLPDPINTYEMAARLGFRTAGT